MKAIDGAIEVLYDEFYDKLQWYECVLDLWWYIGESAVRLSQTNRKVVVYEAHPENYRYLLKNIHPYKNIISHNDAVVWDDQKTMTFYGWAFDMGAWNQKIPEKKQISKVSCVNILDIIESHEFDAIKMDIEWAEYGCMSAFMQDKLLMFKKFKAWIIEFHFHNNPDKVQHTTEIIQRIIWLWYHVECFDAVSSQKIKVEDIEKFEIVFIYFKQ
jgi:FkbM family methyltransferase